MVDALLGKKIREGIRYEALPDRVRQHVSYQDWKHTVKETCVQDGMKWEGTIASAACSETEYYEHLVKVYRSQQRLFPYHMSRYITGVLRVTPFKYYFDVMYQAMRVEQSYDQMPNFLAAEMVQVLGIGRNEYISKLNSCKEKKLLWRVNKALAKELLPTEPLTPRLCSWWRVQSVGTSVKEFQGLSQREESLLRRADKHVDGIAIADCDDRVLEDVYKRGLVYIDVPISPEQRFVIPPLEGFVSNRDATEAGDPMEALLYELFVANSERLPLKELSRILDKPLAELQNAMSLACRLGFATLVDDNGDSARTEKVLHLKGLQETAGDNASERCAVAIVLDAEATSFLMMGSMSPGLKKHSVTLFEGGRLAGDDVLMDLQQELSASVEAGAKFEGEMAHIVGVLDSLGTMLKTVNDMVLGRPVELIRKESLSSLARAAATRVIARTYSAVITIDPLPLPALPVPLAVPNGPAFFGASAIMMSPWLTLAVLQHLQRGPVSLAFVCGQRVTQLPPQAHKCTHALVWTWDPNVWPSKDFGQSSVPHLIEATYLLFVLNGMLTTSAVLVQPLWLLDQPSSARETQEAATLQVVNVPLPLHHVPDDSSTFQGIIHGTSTSTKVTAVPGLINTLRQMGLENSVGHLCMIPVRACSLPSSSTAGTPGRLHVPYAVSLGMPVYQAALCKQVCAAATQRNIFTEAGIQRQVTDQRFLLEELTAFVQSFVVGSGSETVVNLESVQESTVVSPTHNMVFDGHALVKVGHVSEHTRGCGLHTSVV